MFVLAETLREERKQIADKGIELVRKGNKYVAAELEAGRERQIERM